MAVDHVVLKEWCDCSIPDPYHPQGVCAPMMPIGWCVKCFAQINSRTVFQCAARGCEGCSVCKPKL